LVVGGLVEVEVVVVGLVVELVLEQALSATSDTSANAATIKVSSFW
jgi:hypothetical protein